jgi:hypothetical protein
MLCTKGLISGNSLHFTRQNYRNWQIFHTHTFPLDILSSSVEVGGVLLLCILYELLERLRIPCLLVSPFSLCKGKEKKLPFKSLITYSVIQTNVAITLYSARIHLFVLNNATGKCHLKVMVSYFHLDKSWIQQNMIIKIWDITYLKQKSQEREIFVQMPQTLIKYMT